MHSPINRHDSCALIDAMIVCMLWRYGSRSRDPIPHQLLMGGAQEEALGVWNHGTSLVRHSYPLLLLEA
jgi:hypothetical protein